MRTNNLVNSDISRSKALHPSKVEEVGLTDIQIPIKIQWKKEIEEVIASITLVVSLDRPEVRGIHMSRLYLKLHEFSEKHVINPASLIQLLDQCIETQEGISCSGRLRISWRGSVKRSALKSAHQGWRTYPCFFEVKKKYFPETQQNETEFTMGVHVLYSSTCPCSAALSRELIRQKFKSDNVIFDKENILEWLGKEQSYAATPHSQKSEAQISVTLDYNGSFSLLNLIDTVESALSTSVQVAVKREDEQEFARLNAQNLMYTEDAIRRIKACLEPHPDLSDYSIQVRHMESLHPFDTLAHSKKSKK